MRKLIKIALIAVLGLILICAVLILVAPTRLDIARSIDIEASNKIVFPHVKYFSKRQAWYPWLEYDPDMDFSLEGTDGELGAVSRWAGNQDVGRGEQEIVAIQPGKRVDTVLRFSEPFEAEAEAAVILDSSNGNTKVTWDYRSEMPIPLNVFGLFMDLEDAVGQDFDRGLTKLKEICEEEASRTFRGFLIQEIDFPEKTYLAVRGDVRSDELPTFFATNFGALWSLIQEQGAEMASMPCGLFYSWDESAEEIEVAAGVVVTQDIEHGRKFETIVLPATKALQIDYYGPYEGSGEAILAMEEYTEAHGLTGKVPAIQEYVTDPSTEPDSKKWLTRVTYLLEG